jgi:hypothetical protein
MNLPVELVFRGGHVRIPSDQALAILLMRFAWPNRIDERLAPFFGRSPAAISMIVNDLSQLIYEKYKSRIFFNHAYLNSKALTFAKAITKAGAPRNDIWGFVDGTARMICRPSKYQRVVYSGYKKIHCLKFQGISTPDGLIWLSSPFEGRRTDIYMLMHGGLNEMIASCPNMNQLYLYGDLGYTTTNFVQIPYRFPTNEIQFDYNRQMSRVRLAVEICFGRVQSLFGLFNFQSILRILSSPVSTYYSVAVLLTNCRTCIDGRCQVSDMFAIAPPKLEEYLQLI